MVEDIAPVVTSVGGYVTSSRSTTHEQMNKMEEKKRVTQVMRKRDGSEREQEWRRWRW